MANTNIPQLSLEDCADPTGNGQPAVQLTWTDTDGTKYPGAVFAFIHANQAVAIDLGNIPEPSKKFFQSIDTPMVGQAILLSVGKVLVRS